MLVSEKLPIVSDKHTTLSTLRTEGKPLSHLEEKAKKVRSKLRGAREGAFDRYKLKRGNRQIEATSKPVKRDRLGRIVPAPADRQTKSER
jgi:hypothetical protein